MLSQLLRRLLLGQILVGAGLGWLLKTQAGASSGWIALMALGLPPSTLLLVTVITALKSRAPGAQALWWRALWGEFRAGLRVFLLLQPWTKNWPAVQPATPVASAMPVVLVHGYLCNHRVWDALAERLRHAGHPVLGIDLEPLFTSIDQYAALVEQAVETLCQQTGATKIALIGHSMGGLAIRAWMRHHGTARVARVITLGTPHVGTQMDRHPMTANGRQMLWHSDWLQALAASESDSTRCLMHIVLTPQDNIVYPQREQVLSGVPVTVFEGLGHLELCFSPPVAAWVVQQLEETSLTCKPGFHAGTRASPRASADPRISGKKSP